MTIKKDFLPEVKLKKDHMLVKHDTGNLVMINSSPRACAKLGIRKGLQVIYKGKVITMLGISHDGAGFIKVWYSQDQKDEPVTYITAKNREQLIEKGVEF